MSKTIGLILSLSDKCTPQLAKIQDKMGLTEKEAKKLHGQVQKVAKALKEDFKKAAGVCVVAFASINAAVSVMVMRSVEAGDRIDKISQKIGLSRQSFQKWDYILSQSGTDIEKMQVGMKTLSQQMVASTKKGSDAEKMFKRLGVSVKNSKGQYKSQEQAFKEVIRAFQKMPDGIEKANLAQKLFGKTGSDLRPLLNGVRGDVDKLEKKFVDLGMGMSDAQIDAAVKFQDTIDTLQRAFTGLSNSIGADMLPQLQKVADTIIENMPQIKATVIPVISTITNVLKFTVEHFRALSIAVGVLTGACVAFKAVQAYNTLTTMMSGASQLVPVIKALAIETNIASVATKAWAVAQNILNIAMNANPVVKAISILAGLIGILAALETKFHLVTKAINKFKEVFNAVKGQFAEQNERVKQSQGGTVEVPAKNKYASGTSFASGGLSLVGERGPELVNLPRGSQVLNNSDTQKALNKNITINLNIGGSVISEGELINKISMTLGRQLQTALQC